MPPERNDKLSLTHRFFRASAAPNSCVRNSLDSICYIAHTARPEAAIIGYRPCGDQRQKPATHRKKLASQNPKICVADSLDSTTYIAHTARTQKIAFCVAPAAPGLPASIRSRQGRRVSSPHPGTPRHGVLEIGWRKHPILAPLLAQSFNRAA